MGKKDAQEQLLQDVKEIVNQCDRCGTCLTVCPLFEVKDVESSSARGKNNIIRGMIQGVLKDETQVLDKVNFCLLCRTCVDSCPNKIKTDDAMIGIRQYFSNKAGSPGAKYKALGALMKNRTLIKISAGTLKVLRKIGVNHLIPRGIVPSEFTRQNYLASFRGPAILGSSVVKSSIQMSSNTKVAYFKGCGMSMMFPDAVEETIKILQSLVDPLLVNNMCCGLPHLAHGLRPEFLEMAKENIALFEKAEIIVSDCASCSGTLKHIAAYFIDDPLWQERAMAFSQKVMGLSEYLVHAGYTPRNHVAAKLTFHEPCHLGRGQGIKTQPRQLLKAAGNYVEMAGANTCCGGAGSFHIDYPDIATSILDKKRMNIENSGAQIVVSECPTCLVQLNKAATQSCGKFKVMHISQVL
ncbi:(Fe-S)-binding protein [Pelosinus sp. sgz500959]|uniref:(Fe-S)-binding protein n=1 Tax=Pelosinus sp. sgz500959 TaxID=3242472 RepID=UPI00367071AC